MRASTHTAPAGHIAHTPADASDAIVEMHRKNLAQIIVESTADVHRVAYSPAHERTQFIYNQKLQTLYKKQNIFVCLMTS
jgi:hypothetical protein